MLQLGTPQKPETLVGLLLDCHQRIRTFVRLAEELGRGADAPAKEVADACARCERYFTEALPLHVEDEEKSLLPRMQGLGPEVDDALVTMHAQHLEHGPFLAALLEALRAVRAGPGVREHRTRLGAAAAVLGAEFEKHLVLEETVLFPAVQTRLPADVQGLAIQELRARRRPAR